MSLIFFFPFFFLEFQSWEIRSCLFPAWSTDKVCIFRLIPPSLCCSASRHDADVNKRMRQRFQEAATYMCFSASYCALVPDHIRPFPLDHTCMSLCLHLHSMGGNKESAKKDKESTKQEEDQKEGTATPSRKALKAAYVKLKNLTLKIGVYLCVCVCARVRARDSQTSFRLTHAQKPDTLKIRLSPCIPMSLSMHASQL